MYYCTRTTPRGKQQPSSYTNSWEWSVRNVASDWVSWTKAEIKFTIRAVTTTDSIPVQTWQSLVFMELEIGRSKLSSWYLWRQRTLPEKSAVDFAYKVPRRTFMHPVEELNFQSPRLTHVETRLTRLGSTKLQFPAESNWVYLDPSGFILDPIGPETYSNLPVRTPYSPIFDIKKCFKLFVKL